MASTLDGRTALLIERYTPTAKRIAGYYKRRVPRSVLMEDLTAAAMGGLWDAIRLQPDVGEGFQWYVVVRIKGAVLDELRAQDWLPRRFRSSLKDGKTAPVRIAVEEMTREHLTSTSDVDDEAQRGTWARILIESMDDVLSHREKRVVFGHYFRGEKFRDMGKELGVSEPRVSQIHAVAIEKLRDVVPELL